MVGFEWTQIFASLEASWLWLAGPAPLVMGNNLRMGDRYRMLWMAENARGEGQDGMPTSPEQRTIPSA